MRNAYDILGVPSDADDDQIRAAYRKVAKQIHPDRNKAPDAEEKFKELQAAYENLSDPRSRIYHDMQLAKAEAGDNTEMDPTDFALATMADVRPRKKRKKKVREEIEEPRNRRVSNADYDFIPEGYDSDSTLGGILK